MIRTLLVLACVAVLALTLWAMLRGWHARQRRQAYLPPLPPAPDDPGPVIGRATGLYVGTTFAASWQDRVIHDGLGERADVVATLYASGLLLDREGAAPLWLPVECWVGARLTPGLAGKVVGEGGLLAVRWRLGPDEVDTGLRADDKTVYPQWVRAIDAAICGAKGRV